MPLGNLRTQLTYPDEHDAASDPHPGGPAPRRLSDAELRSLLAGVGLGDLPDRTEEGFDGSCDWSRVLSTGEQQRLAAVRIFVKQPKLAILDEATSALSGGDEAKLYQRLRDSGLSYVSVAHRDSLIKYHDVVLELCGGGTWKLHDCDAYAAMQAKKSI